MNPFNTTAFYAYSGLANAVTSFAIASYVLTRNFSSKEARAFFFFIASIGYWSFFYFLWLISDSAEYARFFMRHGMVGVSFISTTFVYFTSLLCNRKLTLLHTVNFTITFIFSSLMFTDLILPRVEQRLFFPYWPVPGPLFNWTTIHFFFNVILSQYFLWEMREKFGGVKRLQMTYFLVGSLIGFLGGSINYLLWYNIPVPPYTTICVSIWMVLIAFAVFRYRMLEPDEIMTIQKEKLALVGLMTSIINHEIKNPLFVAQELGRKLVSSNGNNSSEIRETATKLCGQIERINRLVERLSEFGRTRSLVIKKEAVDLKSVLDEALFFVSREFAYQNVKIELNIDSNLPNVIGDKYQFEEIFLNLIMNALHAMPNGGKLSIAARSNDGRYCETSNQTLLKQSHEHRLPHSFGARNDNVVKITVSDSGSGIPKDQIKNIFKPFYTTKEKTGTGLGLHIVKTLVEQNGGKIFVESQVGKGTSFTLKFPIIIGVKIESI